MWEHATRVAEDLNLPKRPGEDGAQEAWMANKISLLAKI